MVYYTGDNHLEHESSINLCDRPFSTVEEMNEYMINMWNKRVKGNDTVYILGDMFFRGDIDNIKNILKRLHGKKHLIIGNHDESWLKKIDASKYFEGIHEYLFGNDGEQTFLLCHRPQITYKHENRSRMYMIHGHIHNKTNLDYFPLLCNRERILNAGVDINGYMPVTFHELVENNRKFKQNFLKEEK